MASNTVRLNPRMCAGWRPTETCVSYGGWERKYEQVQVGERVMCARVSICVYLCVRACVSTQHCALPFLHSRGQRGVEVEGHGLEYGVVEPQDARDGVPQRPVFRAKRVGGGVCG